MTCQCHHDTNGDLLPIGCTEHPGIENMRIRGVPELSRKAYWIGLGVWVALLAAATWAARGMG